MVKENEYQGNLQTGQRVHSILYGGRDGIICRISGEQRPETIRHLGGGVGVMGGSTYIDVVFDEYVSRGIPEGIIRGVQWYISEDIATQEEITAAMDHASKEIAKKQAEEKRKAEEKAKDKAGLPTKYPYLTPIFKTYGKSSHALGAANLKVELSMSFPGVAFSIRSKSYSSGDSIDVSWTDGPTQEEVEKISGKYQKGHFDGMQDLYEFNRSPFPEVFGGAKYVNESRHNSPEMTRKVAIEMGFDLRPEDFDKYGNISALDIILAD